MNSMTWRTVCSRSRSPSALILLMAGGWVTSQDRPPGYFSFANATVRVHHHTPGRQCTHLLWANSRATNDRMDINASLLNSIGLPKSKEAPQRAIGSVRVRFRDGRCFWYPFLTSPLKSRQIERLQIGFWSGVCGGALMCGGEGVHLGSGWWWSACGVAVVECVGGWWVGEFEIQISGEDVNLTLISETPN